MPGPGPRPSRQCGRGRLVLLVEALLALVEAGDLGLERGELLLALVAPGPWPPRAAPSSRPSSASWPRPGCAGVDLAGQPGQPLAAVRGGPRRARRPAGAPRPRCSASAAARPVTAAARTSRSVATSTTSSASCSRAARGLGLELLGLATGALLVGLRRRWRSRSAASSAGAAHPLAQRGQAVPRLLGAGQRRRGVGRLRLEPASRCLGPGQRCLDLGPALAQRGLVGDLLLQRSRQRTRSSASSRSRASRRSDWMTAARRATSACRPSGLS